MNRKLTLEQETKDKCVNTGVGQEIILNFSGYSDRCIYSQLRISILEAKKLMDIQAVVILSSYYPKIYFMLVLSPRRLSLQ